MEHKPSWEAHRISASQEIPRILWNAEGSLPHSQVPATCPCPEPDQTSLCPHIPLPEDPSYYYTFIYAWVPQVALSLRLPHQNPEYASPLKQVLINLYIYIYLSIVGSHEEVYNCTYCTVAMKKQLEGM